MKKETKRVAVELPIKVYNAFSELVKDEVTSRSTEGCKAIVERLVKKGKLKKGVRYL